MYFENFAALIVMEGHGPYVWSAYAITTVVLVSLIINPMLKKRRFIIQQRMQHRRESMRAVNPKSSS